MNSKSEIIIRNGTVYDPENRVHGEKKDILVKNGKIVHKVNEKKARIIDASGKIVMAAGVDIHSHFAGGKVNIGRMFRPEDSLRMIIKREGRFRSGTGLSVPSTFITGYIYAKMGYSTVVEPAVPPLKAIHTHDEFIDTPVIDKLGLLLLGNNQQLLEFLAEGRREMCPSWIAWMLSRTKTYGIKAVNPGGTFAWGWGKNVYSIKDNDPYFGISPAEIIKMLVDCNKELNLPHPVHLHLNSIGIPGSYETAVETMNFIEPLHITHLQFSSYGGDSWKTFCSEAEKLAGIVNKREGITIDVGQIVFGDTTTMTADSPFEYSLGTLTHLKWNNIDVEDETGGGIVPYVYGRKSGVNAVQWAIGLELALHIKDPWRVFLTTDHPNAGPFIYYPRIIAWLMDRKFRQKSMEKCHKWASERTTLPSIDRELTIEEISIMTRYGTAKRLGIDISLSEGNDANIVVYDLNPEENNAEKIERAFSSAYCTIKEGRIVVKKGKMHDEFEGKTYWVSPKVEDDLREEIEERFLYYTVTPENYNVDMHYLPRPVEVLSMKE